MLCLASSGFAASFSITDLGPQSLKDVLKIARAIQVVNTRLEDHKYLEYSVGIYRAAIKYNIEPSVLIAITQQETGFRENLPEGKSGERGICQVLKDWLQNSKFREEFKNAKLSDFSRPSKAFQIAAWILSDLKIRISKGTLPYWSFYNANKFHNRFKYFLAVNRYIAMLKQNEHLFDDRAIAASDAPSQTRPAIVQVAPSPVPVNDAEIAAARLGPQMASITPMKPAASSTKAVVSVRPAQKVAAEPKSETSEVAELDKAKETKTRWIPDALRRLQLKAQGRQANASDRKISPAILRAATELDVNGVFLQQKPIQD